MLLSFLIIIKILNFHEFVLLIVSNRENNLKTWRFLSYKLYIIHILKLFSFYLALCK